MRHPVPTLSEDRPSLTAIILSYNESLHIARCVASVRRVAREVVVVDSGSSDDTAQIARSSCAHVLTHPFLNHASQFNWALDNARVDTDWVMRIDADEYLDDRLALEIRHRLANAPADLCGLLVTRMVVFQGKAIHFGGGVSPGRVLRVWRRGAARCESRWMDEHMVLLRGHAEAVDGAIHDHSLKSLTWWVEKHNHYASREAVDLLNQKYEFLADDAAPKGLDAYSKVKRIMKNEMYRRLPGGLRAWLYFLYRVVFRLGILDGPTGMKFHFLQALWYRALVDMKVSEVERCMRERSIDARAAIRNVLDIKVSRDGGSGGARDDGV